MEWSSLNTFSGSKLQFFNFIILFLKSFACFDFLVFFDNSCLVYAVCTRRRSWICDSVLFLCHVLSWRWPNFGRNTHPCFLY